MNAPFAINAGDLLQAGGVLLLVSGIMAPLISMAFCVRPSPRWLVQWRDVGIALLGARLVSRDVLGIDVDPWVVAMIVIHLAIAQSFVAAHNVRCIFPPYSDSCQKSTRKGYPMKALGVIVIAILILFGAVSSASSQAEDPCAGAVPAGDVGLNYEGHCILVEPEKGPVQGVLVRRVEDLDNVTIHGIIVAHTDSGWRILEDEFVTDVDGRQFATAAVGDGYHIELDPTEE